MIDPDARIAVVGAGAIGGVSAAFLTKAGRHLQIVVKHESLVTQAATSGLEISGLKGTHRVPVDAVHEIEDLAPDPDVVLLATKANDCLDAARRLLPIMKEDSVLVSLQNGICEDALGQVLGRDRVLGCVVGWGATMLEPGRLEVSSPGEFVVGNIDHREDDRVMSIQHLLDHVMPTRISDNILGELYSKLIVNSCINSLGAITGMQLGALLSMAKVRNIFIGLMREMMAVAEALSIKVEPGGGGKLDFYRFIQGEGFVADARRHLTIRLIGFKYRRIKSSSLQSLERGRQTEVDFLNGYICQRGQEQGIPTPLNEAIVRIIKEIEAGRRPIGPENLREPAFT